MNVQIQSVHFKADQKLLTLIERKIQKLHQFYRNITAAEVTLRLEKTGQVSDKIVDIHLNIPGSRLHCRETEKSFEAAADAAANCMRRLIKKHKLKASVKAA